MLPAGVDTGFAGISVAFRNRNIVHEQPYDFGDNDFFQALKKMWSASIQAEYRVDSVYYWWLVYNVHVGAFLLAIQHVGHQSQQLWPRCRDEKLNGFSKKKKKKKRNNNKKQTPNLLKKFSSIITLAWVMSLKNVTQWNACVKQKLTPPTYLRKFGKKHLTD